MLFPPFQPFENGRYIICKSIAQTIKKAEPLPAPPLFCQNYGKGANMPLPAEIGMTAVFLHAKASHAIYE
jgi:hypothetical protein